MNRGWTWTAVVVGTIGVGFAAFLVGRAQAAGIPASGALTYSGLLHDVAGTALTGTEYIEVKFWNDVSASAAANVLCDTGTPTGVGLVNGHFSIQLPDDCTAKIATNPQVWAEVLVGSIASTVSSLGRAKIGAVPYAVEANHALSTTSATTAATALYAADAGHALLADNATTATQAETATAAAGALATALGQRPAFLGTIHDLSGAQPSPPFLWQAGTSSNLTDATGVLSITFNQPFPNGVATIVVSNGDSCCDNASPLATAGIGTSSFKVQTGAANAAVRINWIAIGW